MKQSTKTWFPLFILFLLWLPTSIPAQEVEDQSEFKYIKGSEKGPENWGLLKEEWATCKTGKMQSPIDLFQLVTQPVPNSHRIYRHYDADNAIMKNRGHDIALEWQGGISKIQINGTDYILRQCHWHTPSEHAINGKRYALELHLVHQSENGKIAVIGILYQYGKPDPFLSKLTRPLQLLAQTSMKEVDAGIVDPKDAKTYGCRFYRYMGSLTTPPCDEDVLWTVYKEVASVSRNQVALLQEAVHDNFKENARPLQPLNGRKVNLYCQKTVNAIPIVESPEHLLST